MLATGHDVQISEAYLKFRGTADSGIDETGELILGVRMSDMGTEHVFYVMDWKEQLSPSSHFIAECVTRMLEFGSNALVVRSDSVEFHSITHRLCQLYRRREGRNTFADVLARGRICTRSVVVVILRS